MAKSSPAGLILHVDDQTLEKMLMKKALRACGCDIPITWLENGKEAIDYLQGVGTSAHASKRQKPTIILLDINIPQLDSNF